MMQARTRRLFGSITGTTVYNYDSSPNCAASSAGDLIWKKDAAGNLTCYNHDALHRVTISSYGGPYQPATPNRYYVYDSATVDGAAMLNGGGRLVEAYTTTIAGSPGTSFQPTHNVSSIAAAFHSQNTFIGQFLGGNTVSGLIDMELNISGYSSPSARDLAQIALGGAGQGIPPLHGESGIQTLFGQGAHIGSHSAGWDGAAGIAVDTLVSSGTSLAARALPAKAVGAIGRLGLDAVHVAAYGQLALDVGTTLYGYFVACR